MEPNRELPPVEDSEQTSKPQSGNTKEVSAGLPEMQANKMPSGSSPTQTSTASPKTVVPVPTPNPVKQQTGGVLSDDATMIADDADLIEKEWVHKAKQIVEQTKHDPKTQSSEMSKMKAQYIKKRYNKDLKQKES